MHRIVRRYGLFLVLLMSAELNVSPIANATDFSSQNYQILAPVVTSGGGYATSSSFSLLGVISEFVHDVTSSLSFISNPGFAAYPFVSTPVVSATGGSASVSLSWTAATGVLGYSVSGYSVGYSTTSGGSYVFTSVGNVLAYSATGLTNDSIYYFVLRVLDPQGITIATSSEVSAMPTAPPSPPPSPSGGGGGGGGGSTIVNLSETRVTFSGRAYPNSTVVLLKDGQIALSTLAGGDARFTSSLTNLSAGSYVFSVYGIDNLNNKSTPLSFPVMLTEGATTNIGGIFISPTIDVDKSDVRRGDNISIFGRSSASSTVTISVHSNPEFFVATPSDKDGAYLYTFDTAPLDLGNHLTKSKAALAGEISNFGATVGFAVGNQTILKKAGSKCSNLIGDLNCDDHVNLIDFSIMAYWYRRALSGNGTNADLNHDGTVNLTDFSILASHWTG